MAIVLNNSQYHITIDSKLIIGVMGDYEKFLRRITSNDIYFIDKLESVSEKKISSLIDNNKLLEDYNFNTDYLNKRVKDLSHSEKKLLQYMLMELSNKKIIVIDEPYIDLDYNNKKKINLLLKRLSHNKTIIVGSNNSNLIYSLCNKVLFINNSDYYYSDTNVFKDKDILKKYDIDMPDLVKFTLLTHDKNIKLGYFKDIRDLIKDVYRNVSQK